MSLLKQDSTRKEQMDKKVTELDFEAGNSKEYKMGAIWDSAVYANQLESGHLSGFYYLVVWKGYSKKKNLGTIVSCSAPKEADQLFL